MAAMAHESDSDEDVENLSLLFGLGVLSFDVESARCFPGSSSGDNYMSVVKRFEIKGRDAQNEAKTLNLIIKRQIASRSRRKLYRCDEAFTNEMTAYKEVIPMLEQHITDGRFFPKCHFVGVDDYGEIIILEDLKESQFSMRNRLHILNFQHCEFVMKELARLHAASIGAKRSGITAFRMKMQFLKDIVYGDDAANFYKNIVDAAVEEALVSLRTSNTDGSLTEAIRLIELIHPKLFDKIKADIWKQQAPNTVICHGDLWINNIMFRTENEIPKDVKFVDFQAMRYTSPVFDLLHFIYTSTKRELRDRHLNQLLETYCTEIRSLIDQQNYPDVRKDLDAIKNSFTVQSITQEFQEKILYGLALAMWVLPAVTFNPTNLPNLDLLSEMTQHGKELKCTKKLTPEYHSRIKDIVLEFYQNGFLKVPE